MPKAQRPSRAKPAPSRVRGWRRALFLGVLALVPPVVVLVGVELGLRALGCGYRTDFFLLERDGGACHENWRYAWRFFPRAKATQPYPFRLPVKKPAGTVRIFVLGDSAALGTPAPAFGFGRMLEVMLEAQYPERRFEMINTAMWGINSHVVLPIARECARHEPDLCVVYVGNNEVSGLYAPEAGRPNVAAHLGLLRTLQWLRGIRLAQLLGAAASQRRPAAPPAAELFRSGTLGPADPRRAPVYANFQRNLRDILATLEHSGAVTIVSTVAVNLEDCPPLASLHRPGLSLADQARWDSLYAQGLAAETNGLPARALEHYTAAARLDADYAELAFRTARCAMALGKHDQAAQAFQRACDLDALPLRADRRLNRIIRDVAHDTAQPGRRLLDAERAFSESPLSDHGLAGDKLFSDHVHFRFDGDYLLAKALLPMAAGALGLDAGKPGATRTPALTRAECAERLAFTEWDELSTTAAMVRLTAKPPFTGQSEHAQRQARAEQAIAQRSQGYARVGFAAAIRSYQQAIARRPADWQLYFNFGGLYDDLGDFATAATQFAQAAALLPESPRLRLALGNTLMNAKRYDEAAAQFQALLRSDPTHPTAREMLAHARSRAAGP